MSENAAYTSVNQIPALFSNHSSMFPVGSVVLDFGGGKYDKATDLLASNGITNLVYDPFNRDEKHNAAVINRVNTSGCDYIVCLNVLNVVEAPERAAIMDEIKTMVTPETKEIIFQVYEGDRSGNASETTVQQNLVAPAYIEEIADVFGFRFSVELFKIGSKKNGIKLIPIK